MDTTTKLGYFFIALGILGAIMIAVSMYMKKNGKFESENTGKYSLWTGIGFAAIGVIGWGVSSYYVSKAEKEKYEEIKKAVAKGQLPAVALERPELVTRVEKPTDSIDRSLILANKCTSIYAGGFGMGAETSCNRVTVNPNGFSF
jgi:hypothetical protein